METHHHRQFIIMIFPVFLLLPAIFYLFQIGLIVPAYLINKVDIVKPHICSDANNESDPSSEYSPLRLTYVMNHYLGQKFIIWVKNSSYGSKIHHMGQNKLSRVEPQNRVLESPTVHKLLILLEMQHTDCVHAFKMADKIARKEGPR